MTGLWPNKTGLVDELQPPIPAWPNKTGIVDGIHPPITGWEPVNRTDTRFPPGNVTGLPIPSDDNTRTCITDYHPSRQDIVNSQMFHSSPMSSNKDLEQGLCYTDLESTSDSLRFESQCRKQHIHRLNNYQRGGYSKKTAAPFSLHEKIIPRSPIRPAESNNLLRPSPPPAADYLDDIYASLPVFDKTLPELTCKVITKSYPDTTNLVANPHMDETNLVQCVSPLRPQFTITTGYEMYMEDHNNSSLVTLANLKSMPTNELKFVLNLTLVAPDLGKVIFLGITDLSAGVDFASAVVFYVKEGANHTNLRVCSKSVLNKQADVTLKHSGKHQRMMQKACDKNGWEYMSHTSTEWTFRVFDFKDN